ncbi:MAG: hypothetical protein MUF13_12375 [Akkermansiaceae bacterium]|nr:hypothetical protein [Akkermansiaceae bacterium]
MPSDRTYGSFRPLANEQHLPYFEPGDLPRPDQDRPLHSAIAEFRGRIPPDGASDGDEDPPDYAECFRALEEKARELGLLYEGLQPAVEGGREHDITYDAASGSCLKFTKPAKAAYVASFELGYPSLAPALPLEYLERQALHNEIFADDIRFVGVAGQPFHRRIVTRQTHICGKAASWEQIIRLMVDTLGFGKLRHNYGIGYEDSYAFIRDDVAVFDMRPANVILEESGLIVPIDSIPVRLSPVSRSMFAP